MSKNVLVIGGTRFFGRLLVARLLDAGHRVAIATRGQAGDAFGERVRRFRVDRRDAAAMSRVFAAAGDFDLIYDQMCYSPLDAAISARVFGGRVGRYVMASTIEVYRPLLGRIVRPFAEIDLDLARERIDWDYPWQAPELAEQCYSAGKRQAEAFLLQDGRLPVVSVRIAHVLAGPEDFTGRLAHYVAGVLAGKPLRHSARAGQSSFISAAGIGDFLCWVGEGEFHGPVNAAGLGRYSAVELHRRAAAVLQRPAFEVPVFEPLGPAELSPFDFPAPYVLDTSRAHALGWSPEPGDAWLDVLIRRHAQALAPALRA